MAALVSVRDARERTIATLSKLFADDVLDVEEFERRVSLVHRAGTVAEIEEVLADQPGGSKAPAPLPKKPTALVPARDVRASQTIVSIMGGSHQKGGWTSPRKLRVIAFMGGSILDFREARLPAGETEVSIFIVMGGVQIIVPPELAVATSGMAIMGGFEHLERAPLEPDPDRPVLRVTGFALMGGVSIETRLAGESERDARRRRKRELKERDQEQKQLTDGRPRHG
jgi:hypothetical protein